MTPASITTRRNGRYGIPFVAYIPVVQVHKNEDNGQFERELVEHKQPEPATLRAIDARFFVD